MFGTLNLPHGRNDMTQVRFRVDFAAGCSIGPGKIELLEGIERTGSLRQAARGLGMSYRRAWLLLDQLNHAFATPVTIATVGGVGGGGAALTPFGAALIRTYRTLDHDVQALAREVLAPIASSAKRGSSSQTRRRPNPQRRRLSRAGAADRAG
jgi:molybdate transport system regulatory protein